MPTNPETILFVGAGATAKLDMPPTNDQAKILFELCDHPATAERIAAPCFDLFRQDVADMLNILDFPNNDISYFSREQESIMRKFFAGVDKDIARQRVVSLRQDFDWPALKYAARTCKRDNQVIPSNFLQNVYDLIDVLLREDRGLSITVNSRLIFLPPRRLTAGRNMMILLMNTMFACAYQKLIRSEDGKNKIEPYAQFAESLALHMQKEADHLSEFPADDRRFYLFSYAVLTTNFDPIFLWLIYQAHYKVNRYSPAGHGIPSRSLQLMLDFPNTLGMRRLAESGEPLNSAIWYPVTEAAVQKINDRHHKADRAVRIGKYYFVHGSANFRQCPRCGRLTLALGDSWDFDSATLFPSGIFKPFFWGNQPRTEQETEAYQRREYDAIECTFCGELTHTQDNFIHTQTHFKGKSPSFIKEITDQALADLPTAKHVVLLGYSFPTDDAIWYADFTAMLNLSETHRVYCSVVCGYDGSDQWIYGNDLIEHLEKYGKEANRDKYGCTVIENAIRIFGKDYVRAYTGGIPQVFHNGDMETVIELLYPHKYPWNNTGFNKEGVIRK